MVVAFILTTQWGIARAARSRVEGFEIAIGRHLSLPELCNQNIYLSQFQFVQMLFNDATKCGNDTILNET
jgi:hypothetical protein